MNNTTNNKKDNTKKTKRRAYESLLLLLLTISLFITATFAWFTDSAYSKGNKIFAGNLYIDILADAEDLEEKYESAVDTWNTNNPGNTVANVQEYITKILGCESYTRKYKNPDFDSTQVISDTNPEYIEEEYYITTGTEAGGVNLYNMEPGQVRKLDVKYVNTGDLAFKAGGALKLDYDETTGEPKSYTGLETLKQQKEQKTEIYRNTYAVGNGEVSETSSTRTIFKSDEGSFDFSHLDYGAFRLITYFDNPNGDNSISVGDLKEKPIDGFELQNCTGDYLNNINDAYDYLNNNCKVNYADFLLLEEPSDPFYNNLYNGVRSNFSLVLGISQSFEDGHDADVIKGEITTPTTPSSTSNTIDPDLVSKGLDTNDNEHSYYTAKIEDISDEYEYRFNKLINLQAEKDNNGNPKKYTASELPSPIPNNYVSADGTNYYKNEGGRLEEVLEVYVGLDLKDLDRESFEKPEKNEYYFGTLEQFTFLMENGAFADKDFVLDPSFDTLDKLENITDHTYSIEEKYILLKQDLTASLYDDYQRYLGSVGGYCLPKDAVTLNGVVTLPNKDGIDVLIYDEDKTKQPTHRRYSEMGECEIYLYMPTSTSSKYQNASISLSIGATATQVEYEMDDTGYMLYDKFELKKEEDKLNFAVGDEIQLKNLSNYSFKVMNVDANSGDLTVMPIELGVSGLFADNYGYKYNDPKVDFTPYGSQGLGLNSFNYNGSNLANKIASQFNSKFSSLADYVEPIENIDQYAFLYTNLETNALTSVDATEPTYIVGGISLDRKAVNHITGVNLPCRSLCVDDIFNYLDSVGKDYTQSNIADIFKTNVNSPESGTGGKVPPLRMIRYILMDLSGPSNYLNISSNGSFTTTTVKDDSEGGVSVSPACLPIFILKGSSLKDIVVESSEDEGDTDKIIVGIAAKYSESDMTYGEDPVVYFFEQILESNTLTNITKNNFDYHVKYLPSAGGISQASPFSSQINNINSLIDEGCDYVIADLLPFLDLSLPSVTQVISNAKNKNVKLIFVGNDLYNLGITSEERQSDMFKYLATADDYINEFGKIYAQDYSIGKQDDLTLYLGTIYDTSTNEFSQGICDRFWENEEVDGKEFAFSHTVFDSYSSVNNFNKFFNLDRSEFNNSYLNDEYSKVPNFIISTNFNDLLNSFEYLYGTNPIDHELWYGNNFTLINYLCEKYYDNQIGAVISNNPVGFECFSVYYNYYGVVFNFLEGINNELNTDPMGVSIHSQYEKLYYEKSPSDDVVIE